MSCASGSPEICISPAASMCSRVTNRVLFTVVVIVTTAGAPASGAASTVSTGASIAASGSDTCAGELHATSAVTTPIDVARARTRPLLDVDQQLRRPDAVRDDLHHRQPWLDRRRY